MKRALRYLGILSVCLGMGSCILEVRDGCPCLVTIDFSGIRSEDCDSLLLVIAEENGLLWRIDSIPAWKFSRPYEILLPKTRMSMAVWGNIGQKTVVDTKGNRLILKTGADADRLFLHRQQLHISGEKMYEKIRIRKYYHNIRVVFIGNPHAFLSSPEEEIRLEIVSGTCGYDLQGNPTSGSHIFLPEPVLQRKTQTSYSFNILKQDDPSDLVLRIHSGGKEIFRYGLGENIALLLHNEERHLNDILVTIDFSAPRISLEIEGWHISDSPADIII